MPAFVPRARATSSGGPTVTVSLAQLFGASTDTPLPASNFNALERKYGESGLLYAAVQRKSKDLARAPLRGMRRAMRGGREVLEPLPPDHPLSILLVRVSDWGATQEWLIQMTSMYLDLLGNAFWLILRDQRSGLPIEIYPINPIAVTIYPNRYRVWHYDRELPFRKWTNRDKGDLLHFRLPNPQSVAGSMFPSEWGMGPLEASWTLVVTDADAVKWNRGLVKNHARPSGVLTSEQDVSPADAQAAADLFRQMFGGPEGAGKVLVVGKGLTYQRAALTPVELDYAATRKMLREEIMVCLDTNPAVLGFEQGDVGRRDEQIRTYWQSGIVSRSQSHLLPPLNEHLAAEFGPDIVIIQDFTGIRELQENEEGRVRVAKGYHEMGVPFDVINERFQLGFPAFPGSGIGYLPFSVSPAESVGAPTVEPVAGELVDDEDLPEGASAEDRAVDGAARAIARLIGPRPHPPLPALPAPRVLVRDYERDEDGLVVRTRETIEEGDGG